MDLTIKYYDVKGGQSLMMNFPSSGDSELQSQVTVSVGILRATGLKDAALNVCKDSPVSMAFAAEVGANAYAKLKLPLLSAKVSVHVSFVEMDRLWGLSSVSYGTQCHWITSYMHCLWFRMNIQPRQSPDHSIQNFLISLISHSRSSWVIVGIHQWLPRLLKGWNILVLYWRCGTACLNTKEQQ